MFNNLIFVNYAIGMGGEFFIIELNKAINNTNNKFIFNETINRYSYDSTLSDRLFFSIKPHHLINPVVQKHKNFTEYFINFFCIGDVNIINQLKETGDTQYKDMLYIFENYIEDEYIEQRIQNTIDYYRNQSNVKILKTNLVFEPSHFQNENFYNLNITNFLNGSKKIHLFCNKNLHYYFNLLRIIKRHDLLIRGYGKENKNVVVNLLFNYYKQLKHQSKLFDEDLNINIGNVYFDNKIIDEELSEFFNRKIKLNYDLFYQYVNKNLSLLKQHFDFNIEKKYSEDEFDMMLLEYAKKQLDNI